MNDEDITKVEEKSKHLIASPHLDAAKEMGTAFTVAMKPLQEKLLKSL